MNSALNQASTSGPRLAILGAGSIGCYIGGRLQAGGATVRYLGRARMGAELAAHGLKLSDLHGTLMQIPAARVEWHTDPAAALADADWVLVCVKSADTAAAAALIAQHTTADVAVLSLQNGLRNTAQLAQALPGRCVLSGMVPFNVVYRGNGCFHQGSGGALHAQAHTRLAELQPLFAAAGLPLHVHKDMVAVQWTKLLMNLNNAVNALSGLPLKAELSQRAYRRCLALAQAEALALLRHAAIQPARILPLPPSWLPRLMVLPDALFRLAAGAVLAIDPLARSSMWEDLQAGRRTEIDWLNGEILSLANTLGRPAPINATFVQLIREAEAGGRRDWSGEELLARLRQS